MGVQTSERCARIGCLKQAVRYNGQLCARHYVDLLNVSPSKFDAAYYKTVCIYDECDDLPYCGGYCAKHWQRFHRNGDPSVVKRRGKKTHLGWLTGKGYRRVWVGSRHVSQHRVVMEAALGRSLFGDENVHHINGVRDDNRLQNLELWSTHQPCGQRIEDKVAWAREILTRYGDTFIQPGLLGETTMRPFGDEYFVTDDPAEAWKIQQRHSRNRPNDTVQVDIMPEREERDNGTV